MSAIGTLVFCIKCSNILPQSLAGKKAILTCDCCGAENQDTGAKTTTTETKPSDFPSQLRQKLQSNVQTLEKHTIRTEARTTETCPKCGRLEVWFSQVQLRGADEGSTTFFNCECGFRWSANN